jgi:hypothetical protein
MSRYTRTELEVKAANLRQQNDAESRAALRVVEAELTKVKAEERRAEREDMYSEGTSGLMGLLQGATFNTADEIGGRVRSWVTDESYTEARDALRSEFDQAQSDNSKSYLLGELGSALIPGIGAAGIIGKAGKYGMRAKEAITSGNAATSAAKIGAVEGAASAYGASEADNAWDMTKDIAAGVGGGAVMGPVLRGGIGAAKYVGGKVVDGLGSFRGMESRGQETAVRALRDDGIETGQDLIERGRELGPEGLAADVGESTRSATLEQGRRRGPGQQRMVQTLKDRNAGAAGRVEEGVVETVGGATKRQRLAQVGEAAQREATPLYRTAYETPLQETEGLLSLINRPAVEQAVKKAVVDMQNSLDEVMGSDPDGSGMTVRLMHYTMQALAEKADQFYANGNKGAGNRMIALKNGIRTELEAQSPEFKKAQSIWAEKSAAERAADQGKKALGSDELAADSIDDFGQMSGGEQQAFRLGLGDRLKTRLEQINDTVAGQRQGVANKVVSNDAERQLVSEIFGDGGDNIINLIRREAEFKDTYNQATSGSRTAQRQADGKEGVEAFQKDGWIKRMGSVLKEAFSTELDDTGRAAAIDKLMTRIGDMTEEEANAFMASGKLEKVFNKILEATKPLTDKLPAVEMSSSEFSGRAADTLYERGINYPGVQGMLGGFR